jgi:hypothetical protein
MQQKKRIKETSQKQGAKPDNIKKDWSSLNQRHKKQTKQKPRYTKQKQQQGSNYGIEGMRQKQRINETSQKQEAEQPRQKQGPSI